MKREIKFRAWDIRNENMLRSHEINGDWLLSNKFDHFTPMQYTGLKDKNEKEIYEGDIIKAKYWHNNPPSKRPKQKFIEVNLPVVFEDGVFSLNDAAIRSTEYGTTFNQWYGENAEIVGNIYENPELLQPPTPH